MGCSSSRIDRLPAVSLCHDRYKFLGEALYHSYAFADAHVAYLQSLTAVGSSLRRFSDQNPDSHKSDAVSQPEYDNSSTNSDSHLDFPSDSDSGDEKEDDGFGEKDFDLLDSIQSPGFRGEYFGLNDGLFPAAPESGGSAWKTPSPPPPSGSNWEFFNFFDAYERYDLNFPNEEIHEIKNQFENEGKKQINPKLKTEQKTQKTERKTGKTGQKTGKTEQKTEKKESEASRSSSDIIREIDSQFGRAADSGNEVQKILDTGKFRYYDKNSIYQSVSWKMLQVVSSSYMVRASKNGERSKGSGVGEEEEEEMGVNGVNLSSTLKKLCMWEKKLYDEVKAEEKLRIVLARSYRQIKAMAEKGANDDKVDSAEAFITALITKIKVAIQVIDNTSITINKLRSQELWPFITQLVHKQLEMWKAMLECHKSQSEAIHEARNLDSLLSNRISNESQLESAIHLKLELHNWNLNFSSWITAQKCYTKAINGWLVKCSSSNQPEEEENPREVPVIFSFCDRWSFAVGRVSEMEVINAINGLFLIVNNLVQRQLGYLQQRLSEDKGSEKRVRVLEKKEKEVQRVIQAHGKMFPSAFPAAGGVHRSDVSETDNLEFGLKQIFKALEKFSADNVQTYEELCAAVGRIS